MFKLRLVTRLVILLLMLLAVIHQFAPVVSAARKVDFNERNIIWQNYPEGMVSAKASHKPVLLIIYTDW